MKIWFDTEFIEDGRTIDLISIGLVREDGVGLYMENGECDLSRADDWVKENVISKLDGAKVSRAAMREAILKFVNQPREDYPAWSGGIHGPGPPEFWSYYCVSPETRILTADLRWIAAGSLVIGDHVLSFDENTSRGKGRSSLWRRWKTGTVTGNQRIIRPCYDLTFDNGTAVRCSAEHRWLVSNQEGARWMTTQDLRCSDKSGTAVVNPVRPWDSEQTWASGYLAAAFDGEGHLTQKSLAKAKRGVANVRLGFSQKDNSMLSTVKALLDGAGYVVSKSKPGGPGVHGLTIGNREDVIRFLGSVRPRRLLPKFNSDMLGTMSLSTTRLVSKIAVGPCIVVALETDAATYIAEGLASHNCSYDWVVLCQLFGRMIDLPPGWPMYCIDFKQWLKEHGDPELRKLPEDRAHNALADAVWLRDEWMRLHG